MTTTNYDQTSPEMSYMRVNQSLADQYGDGGYEEMIGRLTTLHSASSYGIPVFVARDGSVHTAIEMHNAGWSLGSIAESGNLQALYVQALCTRLDAEAAASNRRGAADRQSISDLFGE